MKNPEIIILGFNFAGLSPPDIGMCG